MHNKLYLSNTSIHIFQSCKRRFKFKYIDKIKNSEGMESKYMSFGQSIHSAVAKYNMITLEQYKNLETLHRLYRKSWVRAGYSDVEEEKKFGTKGLKMLEEYFNNPQDTGTKNLIIEGMIKKDLDDQFVLTGKIDRAFINSESLLEVLDYKTGETIEHGDDFSLDLQLAVYVLLTHHKLQDYPSIVSYYYLAHNKKVERRLEQSHIHQIQNYIENIVNEIKNEKAFPCTPTPSCERNCEYFSICDATTDYNSIVLRELQDAEDREELIAIF